jgi:hypothetical protein
VVNSQLQVSLDKSKIPQTSKKKKNSESLSQKQAKIFINMKKLMVIN